MAALIIDEYEVNVSGKKLKPEDLLADSIDSLKINPFKVYCNSGYGYELKFNTF